MSEQCKILHPLKYYRDYLAHKIRPDSRDFDSFRQIVVNLGAISTADGSAIAKIGNTTVVCGIKAELCKPKAETPNDGFIIPNVELPPLCSPKFKSGPPSDHAQVATQLVADTIKNSNCLDLRTLGIFPDKLAWCLYADLICLDYDGSLHDACMIALMAALKTVNLPSVDYDAGLDTQQVNLDERKPLQITNIPCSTTFAKLEENILIDPTADEEELATALITIAIKDDEVCLVHKPGGSGVTDEVMLNCIEESKKRARIIEGLVKTALKSL